MAVKNLVTLEEFKEYKNINSTEFDDIINSLIIRVSAYIKTYCGRTFIDYASTDKIEYFDGLSTSSVLVSEHPIISITSLSGSSDGGKTFDSTLTEYTDFFVDYDTGEITSNLSSFITSSSISPGKSNRNLKVVYKGGYKKLPVEIKQAALDLIEYYKENEYTPRQDFSSFKTENVGFRTGDSPTLPSHVRRVLDMHRAI